MPPYRRRVGSPIFVSVEYDDEGTHHAVISHGLVEVGAARREMSTTLLVAVAC